MKVDLSGCEALFTISLESKAHGYRIRVGICKGVIDWPASGSFMLFQRHLVVHTMKISCAEDTNVSPNSTSKCKSLLTVPKVRNIKMGCH